MTRHCTYCGKPFEPRPQVPDQAYCSAPACQRARKRQWQQAKLQSDPDYRINQRAAQQAWSQRNQDYWRNYRDTRSDYAQLNREQQRSRDQGRNVDLAKMDAGDLPSGLYRITRHPAFPRESGGSWVVEITPVCVTCPCKMDVSRDDVIDTPAVCPYRFRTSQTNGLASPTCGLMHDSVRANTQANHSRWHAHKCLMNNTDCVCHGLKVGAGFERREGGTGANRVRHDARARARSAHAERPGSPRGVRNPQRKTPNREGLGAKFWWWRNST